MTEVISWKELFPTQPLIDFSMNLFAAILVIIFTLFVSRLIKSWIARLGFKYSQLDDTLFVFLSKFAQIVILVVGATFVLNSFGVQTTSIVALLGAAGLAVGLALQGTLSNFAAGIMLVIFRPFKRGDFVSVSGQSGTVQEISIFTTELASLDNLQLIIPNSQVWGAPITNYSVYDKRRLDLTFGVAYASDLAKVQAALEKIIAAEGRAHQDPAPLISVSALNQSSVDFLVRVWCDASDYLGLKFDLTRQVKETFDAEGIDIPFPTTTILTSKD
ncbi:MAG: mechanosensitive ion channel [Paracoccaceae bacterium]|nr:mechanosensitive ion channel [Paracoccaceae bacterium]